MNTPHKILAGWLAIATKKLCPAALERVKLEIQSHFEDAVEAHQAEGLSEAKARARALGDLSDPKDAGKRFRQSHLTESEAKHLEKVLETYRWSRGLLGPSALHTVIFFSAASLQLILSKQVPPLWPAVLFMIASALSVPAWWVMPRRDIQSLRLLLALDFLGRLGFITPFIWLLGWGWFGLAALIGFELLCAVVGPLSARDTAPMRLVFKIQRVRDVWGEIETRADLLRRAVENQRKFSFFSRKTRT